MLELQKKSTHWKKKDLFSEKYKNNLFSTTHSKANMLNRDVTSAVMNHYLLSRCILRICCYEVIDRVATVCGLHEESLSRKLSTVQMFNFSAWQKLFLTTLVWFQLFSNLKANSGIWAKLNKLLFLIPTFDKKVSLTYVWFDQSLNWNEKR